MFKNYTTRPLTAKAIQYTDETKDMIRGFLTAYGMEPVTGIGDQIRCWDEDAVDYNRLFLDDYMLLWDDARVEFMAEEEFNERFEETR